MQNKTRGIEVITDSVRVRNGIISSGGVYGDDAQSLCDNSYHVCNSAIELNQLGLTADLCDNIGTGVEFFGTKETAAGGGECQSDRPNNQSYNNIYGCGDGKYDDERAQCKLF